MSIFNRNGFNKIKLNDIEDLRDEWDDLQIKAEILNKEIDDLYLEITNIESRQDEIDNEISHYNAYTYEDLMADKAYEDAKEEFLDDDDD